MATIIGDYIGATWDDFLIQTGLPVNDEAFTSEDVDLSVDLAGVELNISFLTAAMRSITDKHLALAAGRAGMMSVAPAGLTTEREVEIVKYVKDNAVDMGEVQYVDDPVTIRYDDDLGTAIKRARETGHNNIPVLTRKADFAGMFTYKISKHDQMIPGTPITEVMNPYIMEERMIRGEDDVPVLSKNITESDIKEFLEENNLRFVPILDNVGRLERLVFMQNRDGYKVGAAIDTHPGWQERAEELIEAGADMIFIDTSDAHKPFSRELIDKYKQMGDVPPICGGNVVTPEGFDYLVEAGADVVKLGMGPGSICSTNEVLGIGAPPFWSLVEVARRRDELYERTGKYIPLIADGGISGTDNIAVALTHADAIMGGKLFGGFWESAGERIGRDGKIYPKDDGALSDNDIAGIKIFGEASPESAQTSGEMKRYTTPLSRDKTVSFQGISGMIPYKGRFKPGIRDYVQTVREALYHVGAKDLKTYRQNAILIRLSERAKTTAKPHGIDLIGD